MTIASIITHFPQILQSAIYVISASLLYPGDNRTARTHVVAHNRGQRFYGRVSFANGHVRKGCRDWCSLKEEVTGYSCIVKSPDSGFRYLSSY